ncbi:unnamed protein product [Lactuca saligna]|uniref:Uncharacterized protein n=1 Tax=Lactuca saligna TaxID=75948 RepID=A0AA36E5B4_LACSI|nr:unnamed protein product [Lactuca saligna]
MENVAVDHLSRLENLQLKELEKNKIGDDFPEEYLMAIAGPPEDIMEHNIRLNRFLIWNVVYKELVIEFQVTVSFAWEDGILVEDNLSFFLGGERRTLSLADFTLRTHIYLPSEVYSKAYQQYIVGCVQITKEFKPEAHWNEIANGAYDKRTAQQSDIRSLFIIFCTGLSQTPFIRDMRRTRKDSRGSPLYGGMLITCLAHSFGVLDKRKAVLLNLELHKPFSTLLYKRATIVVDHGMGDFSILDDTS